MKLSCALMTAALWVAGTAAAQSVSIELEGTSFKVTGWDSPLTPPVKGWASIFAVYAGSGDVPPLLGSYAVQGGSLVFHPRFPPAPGVRYRAVFRPPAGGNPIEKFFDGPPRDTNRRTRVDRVYPSGDAWPSNQLRLYIYFSAPMSRGEAGRRIHLLDENGTVLKGVFLPGEELWDPNCQRLTMTFDPGRIKRGLTSNEAMGPPIAEGKRYRLEIDSNWPDARGVAMAEGFTKAVRGGPAERTPVDPARWRLTAPKAGTTAALTVDFPAPMNYPLLLRMLQVSDGHGPVGGAIDVDHHEATWRFTPADPWKAGDYQLIVDTAIEDLAGNHVGQPFDIDVFERVTRKIATKTISLPFSVR